MFLMSFRRRQVALRLDMSILDPRATLKGPAPSKQEGSVPRARTPRSLALNVLPMAKTPRSLAHLSVLPRQRSLALAHCHLNLERRHWMLSLSLRFGLVPHSLGCLRGRDIMIFNALGSSEASSFFSGLERVPAITEQHAISGGWVAARTSDGREYWCHREGRATSMRKPHLTDTILRPPVDGEDCCPPWELWTRFCVQGELHERCFWFNPETQTTATFQTFEPWAFLVRYLVRNYNSCVFSR